MDSKKTDVPSSNCAVAPPNATSLGVAKEPAKPPPFPIKQRPVTSNPPATVPVSKEQASLIPSARFPRPRIVPASKQARQPALQISGPTTPQLQPPIAAASHISRSSVSVGQSQTRPSPLGPPPQKTIFQQIQAQPKIALQNKNSSNPPIIQPQQTTQPRAVQPSPASQKAPIKLHMAAKQPSLLAQSTLQQQQSSPLQPHRQQNLTPKIIGQHASTIQIKKESDTEQTGSSVDSSEKGRAGNPPSMHAQSMRMRQAALASMNVHSVAALQLKTPKQQPSSLQSQLQRSMLPSQPKPTPTPAAMTNAAMGPRQLQVEDALQYLDKVKQEFENQPDTYNQFLEIMKNFKAQTIDTPGVIHRVSELFRGHDRLILGFNAFLPPGFKIGAADIPKLQKPLRQSPPPAAPVPVPFAKRNTRTTTPPEPKPKADPNDQSAAATAFDQAITYVTKIKQRFENDPNNTYQAFLDILHTYQQEQRSIKDVLDKVSELLRDNHDLLQEFTLFLPENVQEEAKNRLQRNISRQNAMNARVAKRRNRDKANYRERKKRARMDETMGTLPEHERRLFQQVRQTLSKDQWNEFLKALELFTEDILTQTELIVLVADLFMDNCSLMDDFKTLLDRHKGSRFQIDEKWFEMPLSEIETPNSRRCSPSYRSLPENFPDLTCSGRTPFDAAFLNDQWISVPVGSEDFNFKNMTKNPHEFALFACEDERFEVDMVIESNLSTIQVLQPLAEEIRVLMSQEGSQAWQYKLDPQTLSAVHLKAICRIYGDHGREILELLRKNPAGAIPTIVQRMKAKDMEWRRVRAELRKGWNEVLHKHYYKALDYQSNSFRQNDKKMLTPKALVGEIRSLFEKSRKPSTTTAEAKVATETKQNEMEIEKTEQNVDKGTPQTATTSTAHTTLDLSFDYKDVSVHHEVFSVLSYAVECGSVSKSEKELIANMWKSFLAPLFGLHSVILTRKRKESPAKASKKEAMDVEQPVEQVSTAASTPENPPQTHKTDNGSNPETKKQEDAAGPDAPIHKEESKQEAMDVEGSDTPADKATTGAGENGESLTDDNGPRETVVYGSVNMFLFLRLHRFIYERISIAKKLCSISHNTPLNRIKHPYENESAALTNKQDGDKAKAGAVETKKSSGDEDTNFTQFLSSLYAVVDSTCDNSRFEDHCRNLMGTESYHLHNIDKLIAMTVKAMIVFATHDGSQQLRALYDCEIERKQPTESSYTEKCAALIRNEVAAGRVAKLEMFRFFMMKGVAAASPEETVQANNKDGTDVKDLLNLEALGIAPQQKSNKVRPDCPKSKVDSFEPQHGWRVVPRLSMRYVPIKKTSDVQTKPVHQPENTNAGNQVSPAGVVAEAEKHEAGKVTGTA